MAGWMTALKFVPWGQVLEATPQIVQGARKLMRREQQAAPAPAPHAVAPSRTDDTAAQLAALRERMAQLEEDQLASAALIRSLAEQNAQLVQALDALRGRTRGLLLATALLSVLGLGLLGWVLAH